jgi:anti-sigma-K factor RskA
MNMEHVRRQIIDYIEDELAPLERAEVTRLIRESDEYRQEYEETRTLLAASRKRPEPPMGEDYWPMLSQRIMTRLPETPRRRSWFAGSWTWKPAWNMVGVSLSMVIGILLGVNISTQPDAVTDGVNDPSKVQPAEIVIIQEYTEEDAETEISAVSEEIETDLLTTTIELMDSADFYNVIEGLSEDEETAFREYLLAQLEGGNV